MKITKEELNKLFEENGYYIEDYALSKAYLSLYYLLNSKSIGQEVYSLCLDGPSGAGKTSFVQAYTKVAEKLLGQPVEFINFQLDAETGKDALYEDIDVVATFENDISRIRIPGIILKAIKLANEGRYVILKMDEYDKSRDSTDTFFNNFLQEGRINTIQHGDVQITPENMGKLQVFLCKNDLRTDLSEPMMRRNRIIRLDYMKPDRLYKILQKFIKDNNCDEGLLNLVTLIYESIYENRDMYTKLPSCSECQQSIMDAFLLLQIDGFSKKDIYQNIIENMLKFEDDVKTFEANLSKGNNIKLGNLISDMKKDTGTSINKVDLNEMIARNVFADESTRLTKKIEEMQELISEYTDRFAKLEEERKKRLKEELQKIALENGNLVLSNNNSNISRIFGDETSRIKRGFNIFEQSNEEWTDVAEITYKELARENFINEIIEHAEELDVTIYENGIVLKEDDGLKLIVINETLEDGTNRYRIMSSQPVIPATYLEEIKKFISFANQTYQKQAKTAKQITNSALGILDYSYKINALVYNEKNLVMDTEADNPNVTIINFGDTYEGIECEKVDDNVYSIIIDENDSIKKLDSIRNIVKSDIDSVKEASKKMLQGKKKVLQHE